MGNRVSRWVHDEYERWLDRGLFHIVGRPGRVASLALTFGPVVSGALIYTVQRGHPGAIWWLVVGLALTLFMVGQSALRYRVKHARALAQLNADPPATDATSGVKVSSEIPKLAVVQVPETHEKLLRPRAYRAHVPGISEQVVAVAAELWVTNQHPTESVTILRARIDEVVYDANAIFRRGDISGLVWEHSPDGTVPPFELLPRKETYLAFQMEVPAPMRQEAGETTPRAYEPDTVEGSVVLIDSSAREHVLGTFVWR